MSTGKTYDPFAGFKLVSEMWEKQLNGLLYRMTDNKEFVQTASFGLDAYSRSLELLKRNQELMAAFMNIPTKKDVANVARLSIQTEEKMDILEEQIWSLQDGITILNKDNLEMFHQIMGAGKELQIEFQKMAQEVLEAQKIKSDLQELRKGLVDIKIIQVSLQELRKEIDGIKSIKTDLQRFSDLTNSDHVQLAEIKAELAALKTMIEKEKPKQKKEPEKKQNEDLVLTGTGVSK